MKLYALAIVDVCNFEALETTHDHTNGLYSLMLHHFLQVYTGVGFPTSIYII